MKAPTTFSGLDASDVTYAPDELDARSIRHWSPSHGERLLRELTRHGPTFVRNEGGTVVEWPAGEPIRPGCTVVDPKGVDAIAATVAVELEGMSFTHRDAIHHELQQQAHELSVLPRATGRVIFDGDDIDRETTNDSDFAKPTGARNLSAVDLLVAGWQP